MKKTPVMVMADSAGNIWDEPNLLMACARGNDWLLPAPEDLIPLPEESELFLLPGRNAVGFNPATGKMEAREELAVAAFAAPAYTLAAHPAYLRQEDAPILPYFAYGSVGYANGKFWIAARKVDEDLRQQFKGISKEKIERNCRELLTKYPQNRLVNHVINNCVRKYSCPAARNFALGRYEAPLPTSRVCNARCLGCISKEQSDGPGVTTPQCRLEFVPTSAEIVQLMQIHAGREQKRPIFSFGQGCEGDPLMNASLLEQSIREYRAAGGKGTINCNTNASNPAAVDALARAGLTSMRVSLNSVRENLYNDYYRPANYKFEDVAASISIARQMGVFVAINLLYFPGITDTQEELEALAALCADNGVAMVQWRNLNIDPHWYFQKFSECDKPQYSMGLAQFMKKLKKICPWLVYGYFNPYLGEKAKMDAPLPKK